MDAGEGGACTHEFAVIKVEELFQEFFFIYINKRSKFSFLQPQVGNKMMLGLLSQMHCIEHVATLAGNVT